MAWIPYELPQCLAFGAVAENAWSTDVAEATSGYEQRAQNWVNWRTRYDLAMPPQMLTAFREVRAHFAMAKGRLNTFPMKDWSDFLVSIAESAVVQVSPGVFQFGKTYGTAPYTYARKLTRFVGASVVPRRAGVPMVAGGGAGQYSFDANTGLLTVQPDQTRSITSHVVGATHRFNITDFSPNVSPGSIIYASGVTGTAAAILNGVALMVAAVGSGFVTVAVNTSGMTATGGNLARRIAASEISYSAEFRVPVRYNVDTLTAQAMTRSGSDLLIQVNGLRAIEVRE